MERILVLDYGSQTTQLIARRLRDRGYYSEVLPGDIDLGGGDRAVLDGVRGVILSGSPYSSYEDGAPIPDSRVYGLDVPILGICYGFQRMTRDNGGQVEGLSVKEYGRNKVEIVGKSRLFEGVTSGFTSWMSHGDSISSLAPGFELLATSENHVAAAYDPKRNLYGIQFHPEVSHCEFGRDILENFASWICGMEKNWNMDIYLAETRERMQSRVGDKNVLLLISGGVDSTVVGGLLLDALDPAQVHLMYIDTGLMRKDESAEVERFLLTLGATHLHLIDASDRFLSALEGVDEPEEKRRIIGDMFISVQESEITQLDLGDYILAQGTLYTDLIESGKGVGKKAHVIKSHHNVRSPLVEAKRDAGLVVEPLDRLYKDEVRALGRKLGIGPQIIGRHPFPGPGLAVRIPGALTREKCDILREADAIYIEELKNRDLYDQIWQAFAVLLPVRSVGVAGDARHFGYVLALRAIVSADGMTADVYPFEMKDLLEISSRITNEVADVGRVVYDVSSKPPATIEWE